MVDFLSTIKHDMLEYANKDKVKQENGVFIWMGNSYNGIDKLYNKIDSKINKFKNGDNPPK